MERVERRGELLGVVGHLAEAVRQDGRQGLGRVLGRAHLDRVRVGDERVGHARRACGERRGKLPEAGERRHALHRQRAALRAERREAAYQVARGHTRAAREADQPRQLLEHRREVERRRGPRPERLLRKPRAGEERVDVVRRECRASRLFGGEVGDRCMRLQAQRHALELRYERVAHRRARLLVERVVLQRLDGVPQLLLGGRERGGVARVREKHVGRRGRQRRGDVLGKRREVRECVPQLAPREERLVERVREVAVLDVGRRLERVLRQRAQARDALEHEQRRDRWLVRRPKVGREVDLDHVEVAQALRGDQLLERRGNRAQVRLGGRRVEHGRTPLGILVARAATQLLELAELLAHQLAELVQGCVAVGELRGVALYLGPQRRRLVFGTRQLGLQLRLGVEVRLFQLVAHRTQCLELVDIGRELLDLRVERAVALGELFEHLFCVLRELGLRTQLVHELPCSDQLGLCGGIRRLQLVRRLGLGTQRRNLLLLRAVVLARGVAQAHKRLFEARILLHELRLLNRQRVVRIGCFLRGALLVQLELELHLFCGILGGLQLVLEVLGLFFGHLAVERRHLEAFSKLFNTRLCRFVLVRELGKRRTYVGKLGHKCVVCAAVRCRLFRACFRGGSARGRLLELGLQCSELGTQATGIGAHRRKGGCVARGTAVLWRGGRRWRRRRRRESPSRRRSTQRRSFGRGRSRRRAYACRRARRACCMRCPCRAARSAWCA